MAGFGSKLRNLWSVPEELEDDEHSNRRSRTESYSSERRSSSRASDSSYRSRYSDDDDEEYYDSNESSLGTYTNYSNEDLYDDYSSYSGSYSNSFNTNKILNINATARLQVVFYKPETFNDDAVQIADELIKSHTVLLNFEDTPRDESKRIVDFLSGCAYVSGGKVQRIAKNIFIITPNNVELTGDSLIDELQSNGLQITE
ncbi:MAG: cell division protein SepF [Acutalibacteraceae bacterium]|jgi:cell division inhibitor SepF|nr:cell division protein SepF [Acutalibacteraceae bacterium]